MKSLSIRDTHRTSDMPCRGMRIALGITNRIPVALHMGTRNCYEEQNSEGAECVQRLE